MLLQRETGHWLSSQGDGLLYSFRKHVKKFLLACARAVDFSFVTPNRITILSIPFAFAAAFFLWQKNFVFALLFVFFAFFLDALDGALAELRKQKTAFGNYLDACADRVVEASVFFGLLFSFPTAVLLAFVLGTLGTHSKALLGTVVETDNRDWPGMGGRPDRLVLLFLGILLSVFFPVVFSFQTMELFLYMIALFSLAGNIERLFFAEKIIKESFVK